MRHTHVIRFAIEVPALFGEVTTGRPYALECVVHRVERHFADRPDRREHAASHLDLMLGEWDYEGAQEVPS